MRTGAKQDSQAAWQFVLYCRENLSRDENQILQFEWLKGRRSATEIGL
jgi:hypothetical protein